MSSSYSIYLYLLIGYHIPLKFNVIKDDVTKESSFIDHITSFSHSKTCEASISSLSYDVTEEVVSNKE